MSPAALVVVPTYNERVNLPLLVRGLMAHDGIRVFLDLITGRCLIHRLSLRVVDERMRRDHFQTAPQA